MLLSVDDDALSFMAAMSDFIVVISELRAFNISITSAMVGSLMVAGCGADAVDAAGDGGLLWWWAAAVVDWTERVGEDCRERERLEADTRLSRAANP
jgi:hypothetical protein